MEYKHILIGVTLFFLILATGFMVVGNPTVFIFFLGMLGFMSYLERKRRFEEFVPTDIHIMDKQQYLASPEWQAIRKAALVRDGFTC